MFTIAIDTREQDPFIFPSEVKTVVKGLNTGDYSIEGFEESAGIERKSLPDLTGCVGRDRERFIACLQRLRSYKCRAVIIEATLQDIHAGEWRGQVLPQMVLGSITSWQVKYGIDFVFAGNKTLASDYCYRLLRAYYNQLIEFNEKLTPKLKKGNK